MYDRQVKGWELRFGVSGLLWNRSLVMYDQETGSLWSHILGEAMEGRLQGTLLDMVPSVMTTWKDWKTEHPQTTVLALPPTAQEYRLAFHQRRDQFGLGILLEGEARLYRFDVLTRYPVVNDSMGKEAIVVTFDPESTAGRIFRSKLEGRALTFAPYGKEKMRDRETGTIWSLALGTAEEGELKGKQLEMLPAIISYARVWAMFHPETSVYQPAGNERGGCPLQ